MIPIIIRRIGWALRIKGWVRASQDNKDVPAYPQATSSRLDLGCVFTIRLIHRGIKYAAVPTAAPDVTLAHADGSFRKRLMQMAKFDLLVLDDFGVATLTQSVRQDLLVVIDDRTTKSTLITSQIPVKAWHDVIREPRLADAILDRIVHLAHVIKLTGETMRKQKKFDPT